MDRDGNHGKKGSVFKRIKYFLTPQIRLDARLLDFMQEHPEVVPESDPIEAPPGEFKKIIEEMGERGIKPVVRKQMKLKICFNQAGKCMQKPAFVALLVVLILGGTSVGVSAKKAYDYRMRERVVGKSDIVWNNDEYVLVVEGDVEKAYEQIEESLNINTLRLTVMPFGMKYKQLEINDRNATIKFTYNGRIVCLMEAKNNVASSNTVVSDRKKCNEVYNRWLEKTLTIDQNEIENDTIEYSMQVNIEGTYYYLSGVMAEEEFISIVENLSL